MRHHKMKTMLFASVAVLALTGAFAYRTFISPSLAAAQTEAHGDGHAHEENEASHDQGKESHGHGHEEEPGEEGHDEEGMIKLDDAQMTAAGIKVVPVGPGKLSREVAVPGKVVAAADRMAQIVPKAGGVVTEARKNLGDKVEKGEIMALIESREMAEAVADFQAAKRTEDLTRTTYSREKGLWQKKITAEQDYLNAKNAHEEASIRLDMTRQKLRALGNDDDVPANGGQRFHALKSPLAGRVIERELTLGEYVDTTHTAFTVADLSVVWVETAIAPGDLPFVEEGQAAVVSGNGNKADGKLIFVSPAIDPATRSAKAIIELDNEEGAWRAGEFANAAIATSAQDVEAIIPKDAIQTLDGKSTVFVRTADGFEKRAITTGREDSRFIEVVSGVVPGDPVAVSGTFTLKAEFGKAEAEHTH